jgi:hypothetical protein
VCGKKDAAVVSAAPENQVLQRGQHNITIGSHAALGPGISLFLQPTMLLGSADKGRALGQRMPHRNISISMRMTFSVPCLQHSSASIVPARQESHGHDKRSKNIRPQLLACRGLRSKSCSARLLA